MSNGQEIANTNRPRFLFETGLQRRTYIPKVDCKMNLLAPAELTTQCPYKVSYLFWFIAKLQLILSKGVANYYDVHLPNGSVVENSVWWYRNPNAECIEIKGLVAFYDEKFDVYVDEELQTR